MSPFGSSSVNVSSGFAGIADVIIIFIIKLSGAKVVKIPQTNSFSYGKLTYGIKGSVLLITSLLGFALS